MNKELDIEKLWNKYSNLLSKLNCEGTNKLLEEQGQRIIECTYSLKKTDPFCGVGGLVSYSLELAKNANKISKALEYVVNKQSIIKICLLSEVGAIGSLFADRLLLTTSEWHREKLGQLYEWNTGCDKYTIPHMSLFYMNHYGIKLTWEELLAIQLSMGMQADENKFYYGHVPQLALLLQMSKEATLLKQKRIINGTDCIPF